MAITWGTNPPAGGGGAAVGDIFVGRMSGLQFRWTGTAWTQIVPPDTRGDVVPSGGVANDRLAKAAGDSWNLTWANAAAGVVMTRDQATPLDEWDVTHNLSSLIVDVEVVSPGNLDPTAAEQVIIVPEVTFDSASVCKLKFAYPVAGTVVVRR